MHFEYEGSCHLGHVQTAVIPLDHYDVVVGFACVGGLSLGCEPVGNGNGASMSAVYPVHDFSEGVAVRRIVADVRDPEIIVYHFMDNDIFQLVGGEIETVADFETATADMVAVRARTDGGEHKHTHGFSRAVDLYGNEGETAVEKKIIESGKAGYCKIAGDSHCK